MATIKKTLAKKQDGGPADAMRRAMGQKPVSTKETLKYVSKHGSGYLPPVKKDTANPNAQSIKKPKAQLGKQVVKIIDKAMDAGKAAKKVTKTPVVDFRKISTRTDVSDAFKLAERERLKKMLQDADKARSKKKLGGPTEKMQTGGTTSKKRLMNVNTIPAGKNKFTSPTKRPMMAKMGGANKKMC